MKEDITDIKGDLVSIRTDVRYTQVGLAVLFFGGLSSVLVLRSDSANMRAEMKADKAEMKLEMAIMRNETRADAQSLRTDMDTKYFTTTLISIAALLLSSSGPVPSAIAELLRKYAETKL